MKAESIEMAIEMATLLTEFTVNAMKLADKYGRNREEFVNWLIRTMANTKKAVDWENFNVEG